MGDFFSAVPALLASVVAGYLVGALPLADQVCRRHSVDIFSEGTGLAGASNVLKTLGRVPAILVVLGDLAKGALAVMIGHLLGVEAPWLLLPALAAIVGHWNSVFTGFRGGDGLATLGGVIIALFPPYGVLAVAIALLVSFAGQKVHLTSLLNILVSYVALAVLSTVYDGDLALTAGTGGLAALVLAHAIAGHLRRRRAAIGDEVEDGGGVVEGTGAGP